MSNVINGKVPDTGLLKGRVHAIIGRDGYSAYELALKHGFVGTEEEWLASLNGVDGTVAFEDLTPAQRESLRGEKGVPGVYIGSGNMPDVYSVQIDPNGDSFSAEDIARISNPNLLDNWYFADPINQRGKTEYSAGYSIDRWKVGTSLTINNGNITWTGNLIQYREKGSELFGKTLTFSYLDEVGLVTATATMSDSYDVWGTTAFSGVGTLQYGANDVMAILISPRANVIAVKLEFGSKQTLAHQDANGNWVLNEIPDYGAELAKCQRYQLSLWGSIGAYVTLGFARVSGVSTKTAEVIVPIPVAMRANPTLTVGNAAFQLYNSETEYATVTAIAFSAIAPGFVRLYIVVDKELTGGGMYVLRKTANDIVMLDANL